MHQQHLARAAFLGVRSAEPDDLIGGVPVPGEGVAGVAHRVVVAKLLEKDKRLLVVVVVGEAKERTYPPRSCDDRIVRLDDLASPLLVGEPQARRC